MNCKLTREDGSTKNGIVLREGETVSVSGALKMCENGIHFYEDPLLAAFFAPIHVPEYGTLWSGNPGGEIVRDGRVKSACSEWTCGEKIPLPEITTEQRVEIAIRCAMLVYKDADFVAWANGWIDGSDRSAARAAEAEDGVDVLSIIKEVVK